MSYLELLFKRFQTIPKGVLIDRPDILVRARFKLNISFSNLLDISEVYFSRRTLKHIAEKGRKGADLFQEIPTTFLLPSHAYKTDNDRRIMLVRKFLTSKDTQKYHIVIVEMIDQKCVIITSFIGKQKYLKNFKILWRTATS
jgi:hypothetical protein